MAKLRRECFETKDDDLGEITVPLQMQIRTMFISFFAGIGSGGMGPIVTATLDYRITKACPVCMNIDLKMKCLKIDVAIYNNQSQINSKKDI